MPSIFIFGTDGSGKTTNRLLLTSYLRSMGFRTTTTIFRSNANLAYIIGRFFAIRGYPLDPWSKANPQLPGFISLRYFVDRCGKIWCYIWLLIELLSYILAEIKVCLLTFAYDMVIIEGGSLSELADLLYGFHSIPKIHTKIVTAFSSTHPYILLDCDYETIVKRRKHKAESKEFIELQRRVLQLFAKRDNCLLLNTSVLNIKMVHMLIREHVMRNFGSTR